LVKYFERDSEGNEAGLIYCGCFSRGIVAGAEFCGYPNGILGG
jgi:hypothetical protein